ncbi:MAG: hypothetical protein ACREPD_11990 [Stenotrophomonas sp.]|uniref:hypothetical protein n=1 Tax=Stenotrophomonas sp. TaxID=69392 RepID=UPI003D6D972F
MSVNDYSYAWDRELNRCSLLNIKPRGSLEPPDYMVYDKHEKGVMIIEDDETFTYTIAMMIQNDVEIIHVDQIEGS